MSLKEKIALPVFVLSAVIILSGCEQKNSKDATPPAKPATGSSATEEKLPEPTGKTEDIVSAAMESADTETAEISKEESAAQTSLDDSQEADDFGQAYDENEF